MIYILLKIYKLKNSNTRLKISIRSFDIRHFVDTSMICLTLNINPSDSLKDLHTFGLFFEDFVVRDLSIYAYALDGK